MSDEDDFFGGSSKSASFNGQPGISWGGIIDRIGSKVQKREYTTDGSLGALKCYPGTNDPIWQKPVTLLTDARDPSVPNDDGRRTIYFEGAKRKALIEALKAAGLRNPVLGDWMSLTYYADEQGRGAQPKKLYRAEYAINPNPAARGANYQAPDAAPAAQSDSFFSGGQQQAQQAAQSQQAQPFGGGAAPINASQPAWPNTNPAASPAANWPPNGAAPAVQAQPEPVSAGPVADGRPWG